MTEELEEIREAARRYLAHQASLAEFEEWYASESWDIEEPLVDAVDAALVLFSTGEWSEDRVRRVLAKLVAQYTLVIEPPSDAPVTGVMRPILAVGDRRSSGSVGTPLVEQPA